MFHTTIMWATRVLSWTRVKILTKNT